MNTSITTKTIYNASFEKEELQALLDQLSMLFTAHYSSHNRYFNEDKTPYEYLETNQPKLAAFYSAMKGMI